MGIRVHAGRRNLLHRSGYGDNVIRQRRLFYAAIGLVVIVSAFSRSLVELVRFTWGHDVYAYTIYVPFVSLYLVWSRRSELVQPESDLRTGIVLSAFSLPLLASVQLQGRMVDLMAPQDINAATGGAFLLLAIALFISLWGRRNGRVLLFPMLLFAFTLPLPTALEHGMEIVLQHGSAFLAALFLEATDIPVLRDGLLLHIPGASLHVAPECSGLRSTMVLFIFSMVVGHLFLNCRFSKLVFVAVVLPLGMLRNALRISVLAGLCADGGTEALHSRLHTAGGPLFFLISLVPLLILLIAMRKRELTAVHRG